MAYEIKQRDSIAKGPIMKKAPLLSLATIMNIVTAPFTDNTTKEVKAPQILMMKKKIGNPLIDFMIFANAHLHTKGFRVPSEKKTKKGATHKYSKSNRGACQLRQAKYGTPMYGVAA